MNTCSGIFGRIKLKLEMCFSMSTNLFKLYLEFVCSKNYEIFFGDLFLMSRSSGKNLRDSACIVLEL